MPILFSFLFKGKIQSGLPTFSLPPFSSQVGNETYTFLDMCSHLGSGIIVLPLVSVLANVAIAKAFGKHYELITSVKICIPREIFFLFKKTVLFIFFFSFFSIFDNLVISLTCDKQPSKLLRPATKSSKSWTEKRDGKENKRASVIFSLLELLQIRIKFLDASLAHEFRKNTCNLETSWS